MKYFIYPNITLLPKTYNYISLKEYIVLAEIVGLLYVENNKSTDT